MKNKEKQIKETSYEINPCQRCPLKDGYGGEYRCSICELTFLRKENERLNKKLKKNVTKNSVVHKEITTEELLEMGKKRNELKLAEKITVFNNKDNVILTGKQYLKLVDEVKQELERRYENKVILDKEEYNKVDNIFKMSISDHIAYLRENERLKEDVQALIGMRFERFNLTTKEESDKQVQQASKEAVEKFYDKINENICVFKLENKSKEYKDGYAQAIADICGRIDQVAKQLDVEIKENKNEIN